MAEKSLKPQIRFAGFTEDWEQRKLGEVTDRVVRKNTNLESTLPLTISALYGLVDQSAYFNNRVASRDVSNYYLLKRGEFAYNKSYSEGFPFGAVKRLDRYNMGALSTLYIVFAPKSDIIDSNYLVSYYDTNNWYKQVAERAAEGARNHGLLNISADDFFDTELKFPKNIAEQTQIGLFFKQLDNLITLHQRKCDKLVNFKKAMLEKMFPKDGADVPEIRFAGFTGAWERRKLGEISDSYSGGTPSVENKEYYDGEIPFIRSAEINSDFTELFISENGLNNSSAKLVNIGDILYALYGATSGEVGRARLNGAINQAILAIRIKTNYDAEFVMQWLRKSKEKIVGTYLQGGQGNLSGAIVKDLIISCPSYDEQTRIGVFFASLDRIITLHQRELEKLKNIKKAMLDKMFV